MQYTLKLFLSFLLTISFFNNLICVKGQQDEKEIVRFPAEISNKIIYTLPQSFNKKDKLKTITSTVRSMSCVNKNLNQFFNSKETTQTIINAVSEGRNQNIVAKKIGTPGMINYLTKSAALYRYIHVKNQDQILRLIDKGADVNYFPKYKQPLLFKTSALYKTKLLFDNGANPDVVFNGKTALQHTIEKDNSLMTQLILAYKPHNKCLPVAVFFHNFFIIKCILQQKNISVEELNEGLGVALQYYEPNKEIINALILAGADIDAVFAQMRKRVEAIKNGIF